MTDVGALAELLERNGAPVGQIRTAVGLIEAARSSRELDPAILEACCHRVAALLGADGAGAGEEPASDAGRACLRYTEQLVMDAKGIGESDVAAVKAHLSDTGFVELTAAVTILEGALRAAATLAALSPDEGIS